MRPKCRSPPLHSSFEPTFKPDMEEIAMSNYTNSDYALNKFSKGIVYRFADEIVEVTLADYLAANPSKTEADFLALKEFSDADYHDEVVTTQRHTRKNISLADADESQMAFGASAEDIYFSDIEAQEGDRRLQAQLEIMRRALDKLTEVQRRRYIQHHVEGLSAREIAKQEGTNHKSVLESLNGAEKKIKKVLGSS